MGDLLDLFPGAGTPAPGPRVAPADLDAMGELYVALLEARAARDWHAARLLEGAVADLTPLWQAEVTRLEALRAELAAELDRIRETGR